jgi:hypothetical protein
MPAWMCLCLFLSDRTAKKQSNKLMREQNPL